VGLGSFDPDLLSEAQPLQKPDVDRAQEDDATEREHNSQQQRQHG
jgi:hypothetical protein